MRITTRTLPTWRVVATGYRAAMLVARMAPFTSTIFAEMSALALRTGAINLGQGFPDTDGPASLLADAAANITGGINQYPPGIGVPALRAAVAEHQRRFYGLDVDPADVLITTGATEAIAVGGARRCASRATRSSPSSRTTTPTRPRSRWLGATLRAVPLRPPTFAFDPDELRAAFSARTRVVLVNTPHNPTGAVFTREQLTLHRRARRRARRGGRHRRGLRAHGLRRRASTCRWRRCPGWPSAR